MARNRFGGTAADAAEDKTGARLPGQEGKVYASQRSSAAVVDLRDTRDNPISSLTADERGMVPEFYGPDGVDQLWVDFGDGKVMLTPNDVGVRVSKIAAIASKNELTLPSNGNLTIKKNGDLKTQGDVVATGNILGKNIGTARIFSGPSDPTTNNRVTPVIGDIWVKFNA